MRNSLRASSSSSSMLPSLGTAILPSDVSPATPDMSFSALSYVSVAIVSKTYLMSLNLDLQASIVDARICYQLEDLTS